MPDRTQTLKDVISALNTLDKEYFKKQQSLATAKDWKMLDHKIEVVGI